MAANNGSISKLQEVTGLEDRRHDDTLLQLKRKNR